VPIGSSAKAGEARQTIAEMAAQLLELEGEHIEVVQSSAAGKRGIISDAELEMLLDRRKEVFEGRRVGSKSDKAANSSAKNSTSSSSKASTASPLRGGADGGLFGVYEAPVDEGNDALAHMLVYHDGYYLDPFFWCFIFLHPCLFFFTYLHRS